MARIRVSAAARIGFGLVGLTTSLLFAAQLLGLLPDDVRTACEGRKRLCESVAVQCSLAARRDDLAGLEDYLRAIVQRNPELLSAGVRDANEGMQIEVGRHKDAWQANADDGPATAQVSVPIFRGDSRWGTVEMRFEPARSGGLPTILGIPALGLVCFVTVVGFFAYYLYLRKVLQHLDPQTVIPDRIKTMLNVMAEGVLVLDSRERIVLANEGFSREVGIAPERLQGTRPSALAWRKVDSDDRPASFPWQAVLRDKAVERGVPLRLETKAGKIRTIMVNATPILAGDGRRRGALAVFDDVTSIDKTNLQLRKALDELEQTQQKIQQQNRTLEVLATRDPLTACLNRRSFFEEFETAWKSARRYKHPLSCLMVDIDHFKQINDRFGHRAGDEVLQRAAENLRRTLRETDRVCRYGGEEFCVLLPHTAMADAVKGAERLRREIEATEHSGQHITVSIGVSAMDLGARNPTEMLDQADKSLYVAKRSGRNCVVSWEVAATDVPEDAFWSLGTEMPREGPVDTPIPFHAVTSLMAALAYRDLDTAKHCRRVADLCVATAKRHLSVRDCYTLEVAALLHDIGKLGVPDAILLKPSSLNDEEWAVMRAHDRMGLDIVSTAFASSEVTNILRACHAWFGGNPAAPSMPTGEDIPLGARLLTIVDAYDAMVFDRVYRRAMARDAAFAELRRCAGTQFDPELVELFIETVSAREALPGRASHEASMRGALEIGREIERLVFGLEARDGSILASVASRLCDVAAREQLNEISVLAGQLANAAAPGCDLEKALELGVQLLDMCRTTQGVQITALEVSQAATVS